MAGFSYCRHIVDCIAVIEQCDDPLQSLRRGAGTDGAGSDGDVPVAHTAHYGAQWNARPGARYGGLAGPRCGALKLVRKPRDLAANSMADRGLPAPGAGRRGVAAGAPAGDPPIVAAAPGNLSRGPASGPLAGRETRAFPRFGAGRLGAGLRLAEAGNRAARGRHWPAERG